MTAHEEADFITSTLKVEKQGITPVAFAKMKPDECTPDERRVKKNQHFEDMTVESLHVSNEFDKYLDGDFDLDTDSIGRMRKTANNFFKVSDSSDKKT